MICGANPVLLFFWHKLSCLLSVWAVWKNFLNKMLIVPESPCKFDICWALIWHSFFPMEVTCRHDKLIEIIHNLRENCVQGLRCSRLRLEKLCEIEQTNPSWINLLLNDNFVNTAKARSNLDLFLESSNNSTFDNIQQVIAFLACYAFPFSCLQVFQSKDASLTHTLFEKILHHNNVNVRHFRILWRSVK